MVNFGELWLSWVVKGVTMEMSIMSIDDIILVWG